MTGNSGQGTGDNGKAEAIPTTTPVPTLELTSTPTPEATSEPTPIPTHTPVQSLLGQLI